MSTNNVILVGNLAADPQAKEFDNGDMICNLRVATNFRAGDKDEVEYHRVVVRGKQAPPCAQYLSKGKLVEVIGRLKTRKFNRNGEDAWVTEIISDRVGFLSKKDD